MLSTVFLLTSSIVMGQAEEPNLEYEQLKVLEPIIGTWTTNGTYDEGMSKWESLLTYFWTDGQKMIIGEGKYRTGNHVSSQDVTPGQGGGSMGSYAESQGWSHQ